MSLNIITRQTELTWWAKATLSGRGISENCKSWEFGRTKEEALRKLKTKLIKELKISWAANYRIESCIKIIGS